LRISQAFQQIFTGNTGMIPYELFSRRESAKLELQKVFLLSSVFLSNQTKQKREGKSENSTGN
jgi:hypothetical protein